ncbi:MAG: N-acetyltransferase, partial [Proteobacteria bacterium]|nr:N-acetyltransferase [Pseudomonadota bacterium]
MIRPIRLKKMNEELQIIRDIYNNAWRDNWGFVPLTESEIDFLASRLKPLVVEGLVLIAEINGEGVGFIASFPDYNQVLKRLNGKIGVSGAFKFLYYSRKIKDLRTML